MDTSKGYIKKIKENTINKTYMKTSPFTVFGETQSKVEAIAPYEGTFLACTRPWIPGSAQIDRE